eukprot:g2683.t1
MTFWPGIGGLGLLLLFAGRGLERVVARSEFVPSYEWQVVHTARHTLPKGLEVSAELKDQQGTSEGRAGSVRARIPPEWTFRVWIGKSSERPHIRPGFARVKVRANTTIERLVEGVAERAGVDPEQITLGINHTSCLSMGSGATEGQSAAEVSLVPQDKTTGAPPSSFSSRQAHLNALEEKLTLPLRRIATVAEARLFSIRHCVLLKVMDTVPKNAAQATKFIDADTECVLFAPRCAVRERRLGACQKRHGVEKCMWQLLLFDACTRVCLMLDEPTPVPLLPSDHLPSMESERSSYLHGKNLDMIPGQNHWTRCTHCAITDGKLLLFDPYDQKLADEEGLTETSPASSLKAIHGSPMMVSRHHPYMVMDMSSIINKNVVPEGLLEGAETENGRRLGNDDLDDQIKVVFMDDDDEGDQYACSRRFVRPAYIISIWSVTNVFHLLWDLFFAMLAQQEDKIARLAAHANGAHLFLDVGHPEQRRRWHRLLNGDMSPSGDSPANHVLSAFTGGLPVHSSAYLESLPGTSCFEDLSAGAKYEKGPLNFATIIAQNRYPHWSTLTHKSATHESTAAGREALRLRNGWTKKMSQPMERADGGGSMAPNYVFETMKHDTIRRLPHDSRQRRALLDMFGLGYAGIQLTPPNVVAPARRKIVFIDRKGSREILNIQTLIGIARERVETGVPGGIGNGVNAPTMGVADVVGQKLPFDVVRVALEFIPFSEQLELFRSTGILVAAHGQGAANTAFLPPRGQSALILAMPPDWFGWHWVYANTAVSVEVHAVVLQRATDGPIDGWSGKDNDRVNAARDKKFNVEPGLFEDGLECALGLVTRGNKVSISEESYDDRYNYGVDVHYVLGEERLDFSTETISVDEDEEQDTVAVQ